MNPSGWNSSDWDNCSWRFDCDSGYNDFFLRLNSNIILSNINANINNCNEKRESNISTITVNSIN